MKVPQNLARSEQETLIRTSAADKEWDFYTRDPKFVRRLTKRGYEVKEDHQGLYSVKIPLGRISIRARVQRKPANTPFLASRPHGGGVLSEKVETVDSKSGEA